MSNRNRFYNVNIAIFYRQVECTPTGAQFAAITAGIGHSVALTFDGSVISWGWDGAGAGNVLTKLTAWCAGIFMVLALLLSILHKQEGAEKVIGGGSGNTPSTGLPNLPNNGTSEKGSQKKPANNAAGGRKPPSPTPTANGTTSGNETEPQPVTGNDNKPEENASKKN